MFDKRIKKFNLWDIKLIKMATFFFTLFLVGLFPQTIDFIVEWKFAALAIAVLASIRPMKKIWCKE